MKTVMLVVSCLAMLGCSSQPSDDARIERNTVALSEQTIHFYVEQMAKQLLLTSQSIRVNQSVAVGTFLPIAELGGKSAPPSNLLGQQIQESFVTLATQAGLNVVEFKTAKAIKMQKNQDVMLSRSVSEINASINADYYLTGTYSYQTQGVVANVRLIEVSTSNVVAAATDLIPAYVVSGLAGASPRRNSTADGSPYHFSN